MRKLLLGLLLAGALASPARPAHADDPAAYCEGVAAQQALPLLAQSYQITPNGYGPAGWGPFIGPFNAGPAGAAALYGPPGPYAIPYGPAGSLVRGGPLPVVAAYGPLGPGLTSTALVPIVLAPPPPAAPGGAAMAAAAAPAVTVPVSQTGPLGPVGLAGRPQLSAAGAVSAPSNNLGTQLDLAALQQAELAQMIARYNNSATYQVGASFWATAYASQALETYNEVLTNCKDALIGPAGPLGPLLQTAAGAGGAAAGAPASPAAAPDAAASSAPAPTPTAPATPAATSTLTPTPSGPGATR